MSWRDRAQPVGGGWKARATPVDTTDPLPAPEGDALDALKPDQPLGATLQGAAQGGTFRFGDEIMGALDTAGEAVKRGVLRPLGLHPTEREKTAKPVLPEEFARSKTEQPTPEDDDEPSLAATYKMLRDGYRADNKTAQKSHPTLHAGAELGMGVAVPLPGAGLMKGAPLLAKAGLGAAQAAGMGAAYSLGGSEKEDLGEMRNDAIKDAAVSAPFGAGGTVLGHGFGKLGQRFGGRADEIMSTKAAKDAEELLASRSGQYSQKVQDAHRTIENIQTKLKDPNISEEWKTQARFFLDSDEGRRLVQQIAENQLENAPAKMGQMAELKALRDSAPADAAKQTADYFAKSTLMEDVLPRAKNYAARMVPQAVADAAGDLMGGGKGVAAGVLGALTGAALGKPGTSLGNLLQKTPRFNAQLYRLLESGSDELAQAIGRAGPLLAAQKSPEAKAAILSKAMDEDPEAAARVEALLQGAQSKPRTLQERFQ